MNGNLDDIQDWLELADQAGWCVAMLATLCNVSVRALELYFHATKGECPRQWLFEQRMRRAKEQLQSGSSVTETALALGYDYDNRGNFSRDFKQRWGCSPRVYQKTFFGRNDKKAHSPAQPADGDGKISRLDNK